LKRWFDLYPIINGCRPGASPHFGVCSAMSANGYRPAFKSNSRWMLPDSLGKLSGVWGALSYRTGRQWRAVLVAVEERNFQFSMQNRNCGDTYQ